MPSRAVIAAFKAKGTFVAGTATTVAEAHALSEAGVDGIVAQGFEAGGHRGTFLAPVADSVVGTLALVPMIVDAVKLPVIAAGGIMDGRGIAAVFALGAAAAALGTAFIPCPENTVVTRLHREALLGDQSQPTTLSRAYTGRYARFLKNRYIDEMTRVDDDIPAYPHTIPITGSLRKVALERNDADFAHIMAGQAYPLCRSLPAGQLLQTLVRETGDVLAALRGLNVDLTQRA
jgi:nitronate monooxygenase